MQDKNILWGKYKAWEGPYFQGKEKYILPPDPTDGEKFLATITATEGGCMDAVNMYDSCIISVGLIQWCEASYLVSSMLGSIATADQSLMAPMQPALDASDASFQKREDGRWRFFFNDGREVNSADRQRELFLRCDGKIGSWSEENKQHARLWAKSMANIWQSETAKNFQIEYTIQRLGIFLTKDAKAILFGPQAPVSNDGWPGALRAAYYSFAANLPAVASEQLRSVVSQTKATAWSEAWCIEIIRQMTFGPKIQIYPGRYNKIRPIMEKLFGVNLPDFADDLSKWHSDMESNPIPGMTPDFLDPKEVQEELIAQGFDLGPRQADGVWGPKTKQAIRDFQASAGIGVDGVFGENTRVALIEAYQKRVF